MQFWQKTLAIFILLSAQTHAPFLCSCNPGLDPMKLIYDLDLDILDVAAREMKFLGQNFQTLEHKQDRHTHVHAQTDATERITTTAFAGGNKLVPVSGHLASP